MSQEEFADSADSQEWIPFALTLVKYPKDDPIGYVMAIFSLVPMGIVMSYISLCMVNRDLQTMFMFSGQLLNEVICLILKNIFRQSRPSHFELYSHVNGRQHKNYGMPSQHCQFQAFFTIFAILHVICIQRNRSMLYKLFLISGISLLGAAVIYSRIYLLYHYWYQCAAGIVIGLIWGMIWFQLVYGFLEKKFFGWIVSWKIVQMVGIVNNDLRKKCLDKND